MVNLTKSTDPQPTAPELGLCMNLDGTQLQGIFPQNKRSDFQICVQSLSHKNGGQVVCAWLDVEDLEVEDIELAIASFMKYLDKRERERDLKGYWFLGPVEEWEIADYDLPFKYDDFEDLVRKVEICAEEDGAFLLKAAQDCGVDWERGLKHLKARIMWRVKNNQHGCMSDSRRDWAWEQLGEAGCPERFRSWIDLDFAFKELIDGHTYYYDDDDGLVIFDC